MPSSKELARSSRGKRWEYLVRDSFLGDFPAGRFATYADFLATQGTVLKADRNSQVVLLHAAGQESPADLSRAFVLKVYRYPGLRAIRTFLREPSGRREFRNLLRLRDAGIPAVEPVAWGIDRSAWGLARSSFLVTRHETEGQDLQRWERRQGSAAVRSNLDAVLREVGSQLRRIHASGLIHFTPKPSNILIRSREGESPRLLFLDLPRARGVRPMFLRRFAQARDLGMFLRGFPTHGAAPDWEPFYEGYLPDPFGGPAERLRARVAREVRAQRNETPLTAVVDWIKRRIRRMSRGPSDAAAPQVRR